MVRNLGLKVTYQEKRLGPKLAKVWARRAPKTVWVPNLVLHPLKQLKFGT